MANIDPLSGANGDAMVAAAGVAQQQQHIRISPFPHHDAASAVGNERPPPNLDTRTLAAPKPPLPSAKNLLSAGYEDLNKAVLELLLKCEPHLTPADQSGSGKEVWR
eukprot:scaffold165162_cov116-Cyclotella_meneghiniana.AAC.1